jgi:predicted NBD/HSP70 family sugar kinase
VLEAVLAQPSASYQAVADAAGLSSRTVDAIVQDLAGRELVEKAPLRLGRAFGFVLSIAVGVETMRAGLVDANGTVTCAVQLPRTSHDQREASPSEVLDRIVRCARLCVERAASETDIADSGSLPLLGVMVSWPSPVRGSGRPAGPALSPEWQNSKLRGTLREEVAKALDIPLERAHAINDAFGHGLAISLGESRSRAALMASGELAPESTTKIAMFLRLGGGVGVCTMLLEPDAPGRLGWVDSRILGGGRSIAGELAHLPIDPHIVDRINANKSYQVDWLAPMDPTRPCSCHVQGHLEALVGGLALQERLENSDITREQLREAMRDLDTGQSAAGDPAANVVRRALRDIGTVLGHAIAGPILLLDPSLLVLCGSLARDPVRKGIEAARESWSPAWGEQLRIELVSPDVQPMTGVRGGALAVFRTKVHRRFAQWAPSDADLSDLLFDFPVE